MKILWYNKILRVYIWRLEFGWLQPFTPYWYWHEKFATLCCGGLGTDCIHEEINAWELYGDE